MKKIILTIAFTTILTFVATLTTIINNIQISNIQDDSVVIEMFNNEFVYRFEK